MTDHQQKAQKGLTLIEIIISFALLSLVLMTMATGSLLIQTQSQEQIRQLRSRQNIDHAVIAIEKRFQLSNQQRIRFQANQQTFHSLMTSDQQPGMKSVWMDFSGSQRNTPNTWLYFHRTTGTLRVNLNQEHNVLISGIGHIETREIIPDRLIRIILYCQETGYHASTDVRIHWPSEEL